MSNFVVLTWNHGHVAAAQMAVGDAGHVSVIWSAPWPEGIHPLHNGSEAGRWLKGELAKSGVTAGGMWVVLPRSDVVLRHLELPAAPDEELPDLVKFQTSGRSTLPIEQLSLDFLPLSPTPGREGRDVLAVTLPKAAVEQIRLLCLAAEKDPLGVTLSSVALGEWAVHRQRENSATPRKADHGATVVVGWDGTQVELAIVCDQELTFGHASRLSIPTDADHRPPVLAEVSRALVAGQRLRPDLNVTRGYLVGGDVALIEALKGRLGCDVIGGTDVVELPAMPSAALLQHQPVLAAILLGFRIPSTIPQINFLKPRQPPPKRDPRKRVLAVSAAGALLFGFLVFGGSMLRLQSLDRQIDEKYARSQELQEAVNLGKPVVDGAAVVGDWSLRNVNQLTLLTNTEEMMPGSYDRPYLSEFEFAVSSGDVLAKISGSGAAKTRTDVETMLQDFRHQTGYQVMPKEVTSSRDPQYPHRFTLELNVPKNRPPAPSSAATNTAGKKTS